MQQFQSIIEDAWENRASLQPGTAPARIGEAVAAVLAELDAGRLRVAEKIDGEWVTITVTRTLSTPWGSTLSVSATSVSRREPGVAANASEVDLPTRDWQMGDWQTGARQTGNWQAGDWYG